MISLIAYWLLNAFLLIYKMGTGKDIVYTPSLWTVAMYLIGIGFAFKALTSWV